MTYILKICWHQHFFTENQQLLLYQEIIATSRLHFNTYFRIVLTNMTAVLMISSKLGTPGPLNIKRFEVKVMAS